MDAAEDWRLFDFTGTGTWPEYWNPVAYRSIGEGRYAFHIQLRPDSGNRIGGIHGGFLAGFAENCMGLPLHAEGRDRNAVTVALAVEYPAAGITALPLEGEVEVIRETGRMLFCRMLIRQGDVVVLMASGTLRKLS